MAVKTVTMQVAGHQHTLAFNSDTGKYEAIIGAPYINPNGPQERTFDMMLYAADYAGNVASVDSSDPTFGTQLKLHVRGQDASEDLSVIATLDGVQYALIYDIDTDTYVASVPAPQHSSYPEPDHKFQISIRAGGAAYVLPAVSDDDPELAAALQLTVKETVPPVIAPLYPLDGEDILTATPTITWQLTDTDAGVNQSSIAATLNGVPVENIQVQGNLCSFSPSRLSAGQSVLEYTVTDNDGNVASKQVEFNVDTPAPQLIVEEPIDALITNKARIHAIGKAIAVPGMYPPLSVSISVNNVDQGPVALGPNGNFDKLIRLQHGNNDILITAKDAIGAASHKLLHATLDQILPVFISVDMELNEDMRTCTLLVNVVDE